MFINNKIKQYHINIYIIIFNNIIIHKMDNATPEQIEKAFRLSDILGLEDVTIAITIL